MNNKPVLSQDEVYSHAWQKVKTFYEARLENLRTRLESSSRTAEETAFLRGQIKECRNVLALEKDPAKVTDAAE